MRVVFGALAFAIAISGAGPAGALTPPTNVTATEASPANATIIVAKECRCVERRWNGSCKRRECRDHW